MTRIKAEIGMAAKQNVGVFGSLNFWPLCPGCGQRHPEAPRSTIRVCGTCLERQLRRDQWRGAESDTTDPQHALVARLSQQVGVNKGFWRKGKPPSFDDQGLNEHMGKMPFMNALYFWGPVGCRKTHMLCARTLAAARRGFNARLVNWRAMCQEVTATWKKGDETESEVLSKLKTLDYLAIDDLGAGLAELNKIQQQVLANVTYDVLDGRYNRGLHTDLSANWPRDHMAELFDERIHRRIEELTTAYCMGKEKDDGEE